MAVRAQPLGPRGAHHQLVKMHRLDGTGRGLIAHCGEDGGLLKNIGWPAD